MQRVVLGRRKNSMVGFRWSGAEPKDPNDVVPAGELGAVRDGAELVTYDMHPLVRQMEHLSDGFTIDHH